MNLLTGGIINLLIYQIAIVTTVIMLHLIDKNMTTHTPRQKKMIAVLSKASISIR